jgi:hypothetical protein
MINADHSVLYAHYPLHLLFYMMIWRAWKDYSGCPALTPSRPSTKVMDVKNRS